MKIDLWEGADLPDSLEQYTIERCWIKVICSTGTWYLCALYMPTEGSSRENLAKYAKILQVLDCYLEALKDINAPSILYGDFNAHIGTTSTKHGVEGNNAKIG